MREEVKSPHEMRAAWLYKLNGTERSSGNIEYQEEPFGERAQDEEIAEEETFKEEEEVLAKGGRDTLELLLEKVWVTNPKNLREELYSIFISAYVRLARRDEKLRDLEPLVSEIRPYSSEYVEEVLRIACIDSILNVANTVRRTEKGDDAELLVAVGNLIAQLERNGRMRIEGCRSRRVCSVLVSVINSHPNEWDKIEDAEGTVRRLIDVIEKGNEGGSDVAAGGPSEGDPDNPELGGGSPRARGDRYAGRGDQYE